MRRGTHAELLSGYTPAQRFLIFLAIFVTLLATLVSGATTFMGAMIILPDLPGELYAALGGALVIQLCVLGMAWMYGTSSRKALVLVLFSVAAAFSIFTSYVGFHQGLTTPRFLKEQEQTARIAAIEYVSHLNSELARGRAVVDDALAEGQARLAEEEAIGGAQGQVTNEYLKRLVGENPGTRRRSGTGEQYYNLLAQTERLRAQQAEIERGTIRLATLRQELATLDQASPEMLRALLEEVRTELPSGVLSLVQNTDYEPPSLPEAIYAKGEVVEEQWHRAVRELFAEGNLVAVLIFLFAVFFDLMILGMSVSVGNLREVRPQAALPFEQVFEASYGRGRGLRKALRRWVGNLGPAVELRGAGWVYPYRPPERANRKDLECEDLLEEFGYLEQSHVDGDPILYVQASLYSRLLRLARSLGVVHPRDRLGLGADAALLAAQEEEAMGAGGEQAQ